MRVVSEDLWGYVRRALEEIWMLDDQYSALPSWNNYLLPLFYANLKLICEHPNLCVEMEWYDEANIRYGYRASITGLLGETITTAKLLPICGIEIVQDRMNQSWLGIDIITSIGTIQSKVVRFKGEDMLVFPNMLTHTADFTSITDIDDGITCIVPREALLGKTTASKTYLQQNCIFWFIHDKIEPILDYHHLVNPTEKYKKIIHPD